MTLLERIKSCRLWVIANICEKTTYYGIDSRFKTQNICPFRIDFNHVKGNTIVTVNTKDIILQNSTMYIRSGIFGEVIIAIIIAIIIARSATQFAANNPI